MAPSLYCKMRSLYLHCISTHPRVSALVVLGSEPRLALLSRNHSHGEIPQYPWLHINSVHTVAMSPDVRLLQRCPVDRLRN